MFSLKFVGNHKYPDIMIKIQISEPNALTKSQKNKRKKVATNSTLMVVPFHSKCCEFESPSTEYRCNLAWLYWPSLYYRTHWPSLHWRTHYLGKHSLFLWLFVSSVKTGTTSIIRLDELSSVVRRLLYYKAAILMSFSARSTKILLLLQIKVPQFSSFSKQ